MQTSRSGPPCNGSGQPKTPPLIALAVTKPDGPAIVAQPLFDWFALRFAHLDWVFTAASLAPGLPPRDMPARTLQRFLLEEATYSQRDQIWAAVIARARHPATAQAYQTLAVYLASMGLRKARRKRLGDPSPDERPDVDHDLVYGFVRRLHTIDLGLINLAGKLIDSGITHAKTERRKHRQRPQPSPDVDTLAAGQSSTGLEAALNELITDMADHGLPLDEEDVKLLVLTVFDKLTVVQAAEKLGIGLQAAYKRSQRARTRIQEHLAARAYDLGTRATSTRRDATAAGEAAGPPTRRKAAPPDPPR